MKTKIDYRLPLGGATTNVKRYIKAWRDIYVPFLEATGAEMIGFDPGFLISFKGRSIDLPIGFVVKINELLQKKA